MGMTAAPCPPPASVSPTGSRPPPPQRLEEGTRLRSRTPSPLPAVPRCPWPWPWPCSPASSSPSCSSCSTSAGTAPNSASTVSPPLAPLPAPGRRVTVPTGPHRPEPPGGGDTPGGDGGPRWGQAAQAAAANSLLEWIQPLNGFDRAGSPRGRPGRGDARQRLAPLCNPPPTLLPSSSP